MLIYKDSIMKASVMEVYNIAKVTKDIDTS